MKHIEELHPATGMFNIRELKKDGMMLERDREEEWGWRDGGGIHFEICRFEVMIEHSSAWALDPSLELSATGDAKLKIGLLGRRSDTWPSERECVFWGKHQREKYIELYKQTP